jgi:type II secretory pathway component PulL
MLVCNRYWYRWNTRYMFLVYRFRKWLFKRWKWILIGFLIYLVVFFLAGLLLAGWEISISKIYKIQKKQQRNRVLIRKSDNYFVALFFSARHVHQLDGESPLWALGYANH